MIAFNRQRDELAMTDPAKTDGDPIEQWKKLKRLRWNLIIIFVVFGLLAGPSFRPIFALPDLSSREDLSGWTLSILYLLFVPAIISAGIRERRARLTNLVGRSQARQR